MQSAALRHSGGGTQSPSSQTCGSGQGTVGHVMIGWQRPKLHSSPLRQSLSRSHMKPGIGTQAPSMHTGADAGQSASFSQPPGTTQVRSMQTMPSNGQSSSRPQKKGGKQRLPAQRQPLRQSPSVSQRIGWQ